MGKLINLIFFTAILLGCSESRKDNSINISSGISSNHYSTGFKIILTDSCNYLNIINPWQGAKDVSYKYALVNDSTEKYDIPEDVHLLKTPLQRVVCLSTTHVAFLDILGESSKIFGVSGSSFIYSQNVNSRIKSGFVKDVGYDQNLNYELIVSLKPDIVFCYGVGAESLGYLNKFNELGVEFIFIGDYLEDHPLGKAEWIKVFGLLTGNSSKADSIFNKIEDSYLEALKLVSSPKEKPYIFLNAPYKDIWYFPGSSSYFIQLINDAGGQYIFKDLEGSRTYPISFEKALESSYKANIWLNPGIAKSIDDIRVIDERLSILPLLKKGNVYNNNRRESKGGGNDFWESGVVRPDLILKDLINIFHPEILPEYQLYYYQKLK